MSIAAQTASAYAKPLPPKALRHERAAPVPQERPSLPPVQPRFADWAMI